MSVLRAWLLRVTAAGMLCAAAESMCPKDRRAVIRLCSAAVLALVTLSPLKEGALELPKLSDARSAQLSVESAQQQALALQLEEIAGRLAACIEEETGCPAEVACRSGDAGLVIGHITLRAPYSTQIEAQVCALCGVKPDALSWEEP